MTCVEFLAKWRNGDLYDDEVTRGRFLLELEAMVASECEDAAVGLVAAACEERRQPQRGLPAVRGAAAEDTDRREAPAGGGLLPTVRRDTGPDGPGGDARRGQVAEEW